MTIQGAIAEGYSVAGTSPKYPKVGDTIRMWKSKPFPFDLNPIGWDRWGPRFAPLHDDCLVVLQSQEDLDFLRRQK